MFSKKCKYAIRSVLYLTIESSPEKRLKGSKEVAAALKLPIAYTGKILLQLAKDNIITSIKGPGGGFYLSSENKKLPLIRIVDAMGDNSFFTSCGLGLDSCSDERPCPIHNTFKVGRDQLLQLFNSKKIGDLELEISQHELFLVR